MTETLTIDFGKPIPLFPLPDCVLLPHATVPLHIFEPRYRAMVKEALGAQGLIAMAVFDGSQWHEDYHGTPPIRPFVCMGYIVRHQGLADGKYNLLLQGVCRAKVLHELDHEPYRMATLMPVRDESGSDEDLLVEREMIEAMLADPLLQQLATVSAIHNWLSHEIPTAALVDLAVMHMADDSEQRYDMLAQPDARQRAMWLERHLAGVRRAVAMAQRFPDPHLEDQVFLN